MNIKIDSERDAQILKYFRKHGCVDISTVSRALPRVHSVEERVAELSKQQMSNAATPAHRHPIPNTSCLVRRGQGTEAYQITATGLRALQDFEDRRRRERRLLWLKTAWIPILVSFLTNLVLSGPKPLLPLIQEWVQEILQKTP